MTINDTTNICSISDLGSGQTIGANIVDVSVQIANLNDFDPASDGVIITGWGSYTLQTAMIEDDGSGNDRWIDKALEEAPSGGGGTDVADILTIAQSGINGKL
jgi:hypothetical protein